MDGNWIIWVPALLACGSLAGFLGGLLGVGGGIVIVPVLYHLYSLSGLPLDMTMPLAVGTSLAAIVMISAISARAHYLRGSVDRDVLRLWTPAGLVGVLIGTWLGGAVMSGMVLKIVFGAVLIVVALHMLVTARSKPVVSDGLPGQRSQQGLSFGVGGLASMLGIGGGTLSVPILNLFSYPIHRAVGTSAAFGLFISVPAAVGYVVAGWGVDGLPTYSSGYLNWFSLVLLVPTSMLFVPLGARLCHRLAVARLRQAFAVFILLVGLEMAFL